eukprot:1937-Heterococcus_DN1.PRE.1
MLLLGWLRYNRQQQQLPPAAATPKSERRGTVLSPTRRNSADDRQSTAAADEDRPAAELGQAAAHLADAALADAARANTAAAQQHQHAGQLLEANLHADDPESSSTGLPAVSAGGLQALGRPEVEPNGHQGDGSSAPHLATAAADCASPLDTFMGHSAQHSSGLPGGVTGDGVATSASLAPVAAATARTAAVQPEQASPIASTSLALPLEDAETRSNSSSSAESDISTVSPGPTLAPVPATDSMHQDVAAADLLAPPDSQSALTSNLGEASTATRATGGAAQQRTASTDEYNATPAPPTPTAATGGADALAESTTSSNRIMALYDELSDSGSDAEDEQEEFIDDDAAAPASPHSTGIFPGGGSDTDEDADDAHMHYYGPVCCRSESLL